MSTNDLGDGFSHASHSQTAVLVVDDNVDGANMMAEVLQLAGFQVVYTAYDGVEALKIVADHTVNLVISDIDMPRLGGLDLTRQLRAQEATHNLPVILTSGRGNSEMAEQCGANGFMTKPAGISDMIGLIHRLIDVPSSNDQHALDPVPPRVFNHG